MATGYVRQVIGTVIDVEFPTGDLPEIFNAVNVEMGDNGSTKTLVTEVQQHLGNNWVRCLALDATEGLQRGAAAEGFVCRDHTVEISGLCPHCREA